MSIVDRDKQQVLFKIVYYGPGLCGKTTNLQYIFNRTDPTHRSKLVSLATETERTLFFNFTPQTLRPIHGLTPVIHLYTVPGPVFYDASRRLVLKGADGIVYVADSQVERSESNLEMFENLRANLESHGCAIDEMPLVLQYNKRDLPNAAPVADLQAALNPKCTHQAFEAVAHTGQGVFDTLKAVVGEVLLRFEPNYTP